MASDAGPAAPAGAPLPARIDAAKRIQVLDPTNPTAGRSTST